MKKVMIQQCTLAIALICMGLSIAFAQDVCEMSPAEEQTFLAMSFQDFDQTPIGWRRLAKLGCYHQMGLLIDNYLMQHKRSLEEWQKISLTWHAGQMYAFNNDYQLAKERFRASLDPNERKRSPIRWNAYVNATIAFLDKNMAQLQFYRIEIEEGPLLNGKKANLEVVEQLILNFDQPYSVAYCKAEQ